MDNPNLSLEYAPIEKVVCPLCGSYNIKDYLGYRDYLCCDCKKEFDEPKVIYEDNV